MTDEMIALARRAVACKGWRWMPGMLFVNENGTRIRFVVELGTHAIGMVQGGGHPSWREPLPLAGVLPNLADAGTLGCLLALVREAWMSERCFARLESTWFVICPTPDEVAKRIGHGWSGPFCGTTEAEALVAALEAAP